MPVIARAKPGIRGDSECNQTWHPTGTGSTCQTDNASGSRAAGRGPAAAPNFKLLKADGTATHVPGVSRLVRRARPVAP